MTLCSVEGRPDMYGLGIRLAFYITWFFSLFFEYHHEDDLPDLRLMGFMLSLAVTTGMIIQVSQHNLEPIDIIISLILTMGIYAFFIPVYAWRVVTCFNHYLDPMKNSEEVVPPVFRLPRFLLLLVNTGVGIWFFTTYLVDLRPDCEQYVFFLSRMRIEDKIYIVFGAIFFIGIVIACIAVFLFQAGWKYPASNYKRPTRQRRKMYRFAIRQYRILANLTIFALLVAAIELPIQWNKLHEVNQLDTSAQLIPLLIVMGFVFRVCGQHWLYHGDDDDEEEEEEEEGEGDGPPSPVSPLNLRMNAQPGSQDVRWSEWMPQMPLRTYK